MEKTVKFMHSSLGTRCCIYLLSHSKGVFEPRCSRFKFKALSKIKSDQFSQSLLLVVLLPAAIIFGRFLCAKNCIESLYI